MTLFWMPGSSVKSISTPQVAAGDHDGVGSGQDAVDVIDALAVLDLGDDADVGVVLVQQVADVVDVLCGAHEGSSDEVEALLDTEDDVIPVALAQVGHGQVDAGDIDALLGLDLAAVEHFADDVGVRDALDGQLDEPSSSMMVPPSWTSWGRSL